ncbi:MAG: L-aspartate oxidase [Planctomycetota bacterium]|nr:L-aspartate oxidase [Planctomycetota bacterium]
MPEPYPRYLLPFDTFRLPHHLTDVLVIGAGVAGYSAALGAAEAGLRVQVLTKDTEPSECNTWWAQGGVAAVMEGEDDSPELHAEDTIAVGQGLCDEPLVHGIATEAHDRIEELIALGARFDEDEIKGNGTAKGLEGGHSRARILHAGGDATGAEICRALGEAADAHRRVIRWQDAFVVDLLTDDDGRCRGALVSSRGHLRAIWAGAVVLASGGYAQIFRESTNYSGATGDGAAIAWRAGAELQDLEFVQFHPTTLYLAGVPRLLITEAVRGEGAHVVDQDGNRFLLDVDERAELAPRDVISRAITKHLERPGVAGVFLEMTHLDHERLARRFPGVARSCRQHGLDIAHDRIPIRPAAHYSIGGVRTDQIGATRVPGLYAAGEVSACGLHGANRLASNSLLEGLVMGRRAGRAAAAHASAWGPDPVRMHGEGTGSGRGTIDVDDLRTSLKSMMWRDVGIQRNGGNLTGASGAMSAWEGFACRVGDDAWERLSLINMLGVARLLTESAFLREESRGTHFRRDFPERDDEAWQVRIVHHRDEGLKRVAVNTPQPAAPQGAPGMEPA